MCAFVYAGDEGSLQDMFADGSDDEKEGGEDPDEKQWRMERYEREKFLQSQQVGNWQMYVEMRLN